MASIGSHQSLPWSSTRHYIHRADSFHVRFSVARAARQVVRRHLPCRQAALYRGSPERDQVDGLWEFWQAGGIDRRRDHPFNDGEYFSQYAYHPRYAQHSLHGG